MAALEARSLLTCETNPFPDALYPLGVGGIVRTVGGFRSVWAGGMRWRLQRVLGEPIWLERMGANERRGMTPLFWGHVNPYGTFQPHESPHSGSPWV